MSKYTDWVITLPCCVSGHIADDYMGIDPHHIKGCSWLTGSGWALKGSDLTAIPLRHDLHNELHNIGWQSFENKYNLSQKNEMIKTILRAEKEGVIIV